MVVCSRQMGHYVMLIGLCPQYMGLQIYQYHVGLQGRSKFIQIRSCKKRKKTADLDQDPTLYENLDKTFTKNIFRHANLF